MCDNLLKALLIAKLLAALPSLSSTKLAQRIAVGPDSSFVSESQANSLALWPVPCRVRTWYPRWHGLVPPIPRVAGSKYLRAQSQLPDLFRYDKAKGRAGQGREEKEEGKRGTKKRGRR